MGLFVRIPNAFTVHQLGTPSGPLPYPFGVSSYERTDDAFSMILFPVSLVDLCDILARFARIVVFDVSHTTLQSGKPVSLSEIAAARGVDCHAIDAETIVFTVVVSRTEVKNRKRA